MPRNKEISKKGAYLLIKITLLISAVLMLSAFSFSDSQKLRHELRSEIKTELQKIIEKTPSAKLRKKWRQERDRAADMLEAAENVDTSKYCPEKWDEAVAMFKKARYYALRRSYRKAIYLAKKASEFAYVALETSQAFLSQNQSKLNIELRKLKAKIEELTGMIPINADELTARASEISLAVEDIRLAIKLREFKDARMEIDHVKARLAQLLQDIKIYKKSHPDNNEDI